MTHSGRPTVLDRLSAPGHPLPGSRSMTAVRLLFIAMFFMSGVAALLYQVIWQRVLTFTTGADVYSVTLVVAAFMAGMGLGSLAGGHVADRLDGRGRLYAFAACELAIALFALVSAAFFYDWLYARLGTRDLSLAARGGISFVATLWPTLFMGMSLPLAARALTDDARQPARWVPLLYGWNTLGAACGAALAVTVLFRAMDFASSLRLGAAISMTCAVIAVALAGRLSPAARDGWAPAAAETPTGEWAHLRGPILLYALSGFIALSLEVVWFRVLGVIIKSSALTFGHLLAIYLGGLALGSIAANHRMVSTWPARRAFLLSQAAIPIYAAGALALLVGFVTADTASPIFDHLKSYEGFKALREMVTWRGFLILIVVPVFLMGLPTLLMGFSFGFLQRSVQSDLVALGRRVGWLQAANIAGAVLGALLTGFLLLDLLGTTGTLRLLAAAGGVFLWLAMPPRFLPRAAAVVTTAAAVAIGPGPAQLWPRLHGTDAERSVFAEDSSGVALLRLEPDGIATVFAQGLGQSRLPFGGVHTVLGAIPVLIHPRPDRVAVIGLGSGDTTWSVGGRAETTRIDSVEIVAPALTVLHALARAYPYPGLGELLLDSRVRHHLTDGRAFLLRSEERYDVIEADALRPTSAYAGNLYSVEYFELLKSRLLPGGFAVTWLPTSRVLDTLVAVFPYVVVVGEVGIGSERPIPFDVATIWERVKSPHTLAYYARGGVRLPELLQPYLERSPRTFGPEFDRRRLTDVNRDLFPRDEFRVGTRD